MPLQIQKLSLLDSLQSLRQTNGNAMTRQEHGFSDTLDKAIAGTPVAEAMTPRKARDLAESLSIQMLQASISIAGDSASETAQTRQLSSVNSLMQAYLSNQPKTGEPTATVPVETSPLPAEDAALTAPVQKPSPTSRDSSWLDPLIAKASRKYGVEVGLIKAVIKAESNFNPQAVSHAGAQGLMQLMPATARSLGVSDSFDPEQNVMAGTRFLRDMLNRYGGDVESALAAYNWGPGNVDRHPDRLPRETRNYQARVKQLYSSYTG